MKWYMTILEKMKIKNVYTHDALVEELKKVKCGLSTSAYNWVISKMIKEGALEKLGYDSYILYDNNTKPTYYPFYSNIAYSAIKLIRETYPYIEFTVFETVQMNEFLNHLIGQNTIFIQIEKESSIHVFRFLQERGFENILYKPDIKDFELYWNKDCIVIMDMISEAPLRTTDRYAIMLEKMLVDIISDKIISLTYNKAEYADIIEQAQERYLIDRVRMLRYARRRNKKEEIKKYLERRDAENVAS